MEYYAENLEFEKAEKVKQDISGLRKIFTKDEKSPKSLNDSNFVLLTAASSQEKTIDLYMVKTGLLNYHKTIGRKAELTEMKNELHTLYFNGRTQLSVFSKEDVDEIRIVSSWIHRQNGYCQILNIENKTETELISELETSIRNFAFEEEENQNENSL